MPSRRTRTGFARLTASSATPTTASPWNLAFHAARDAVAALGADADPTTVFNTAAKSFLNAVGASSGPLYATAFMRAGAAVKGKAELSDAEFVVAFQAMAQGIRDRGKAEPGEKTMIDAWVPAAARSRQGLCGRGSGLRGIRAAAKAAAEGAEATKAMVAAKGRSARLGDRSIGHIDPGAASAVTVIRRWRQLPDRSRHSARVKLFWFSDAASEWQRYRANAVRSVVRRRLAKAAIALAVASR